MTTLSLFILAHPGHGTIPADSPAHYLVEPAHAVWTILLLALTGTAVLLYRRQIAKRKLQRVAARKPISRSHMQR